MAIIITILNFYYFRELHVASGKWTYGNSVSKGSINGKTSASPVEILKHSIRRAWTINGTISIYISFVCYVQPLIAYILFHFTYTRYYYITLRSNCTVDLRYSIIVILTVYRTVYKIIFYTINVLTS